MRKKKSSPSWTKGDTLFLAVVVAVSVTASWGLERAFDAVAQKGTQEIGTIVFKQKVAERKLSSQAVWGRIDNKAPVYNFDTVRTGTGASAVVTLQDGTEIHLDEDTMVGLELTKKDFSVSLVRGKLAAKRVTITPRTFSITAKGVDVVMENGDVTVANGDSGVSLQADTRVEVASAGGTSTVDPSQTVLIREGQAPVVRKLASTLLEPADQAYSFSGASVQTVTFRWKTETAGNATLQLTDKDFAHPLKQTENDKGQASFDLAEGTYLWRVSAGGVPSEARSLVVYREAAPTPAEPRGLQETGADETLVPFAWSKTPDAGSYRLEIFNADSPSAPPRTVTTPLTSLSVPLAPGKYRWRVVGTYAFAQAEVSSANTDFELRKLGKLPPPVAAADVKTQFSALAADSVLGWQPVPSAERYEVVIARDPEFKQVVSTTETTANVLRRPAGLVPGDYYWRVRAIAQNLVSDPSSTREFAVAASLPLVGLAPRSVVSGPLALTWNDPNHGRTYRVEVSSSREFTDIAGSLDAVSSSGSESRSAALPWNRPGAFFWRVSLVDGAGAVLASSAPLGFVVAGGLPQPVLLAPAPLVDINDIPSLGFRWKPVPGAGLYRLTLSRTLAGRPQEVFRGETTQTSLNLDRWELLALGSYAWRLVAVSDNDQSLESAAQFALTQARPLKAVSLRVPRVIYVPETQ